MAEAPLRRIVDWLLDREGCPARTRAVLSGLVLAAFTALVIVGAVHHEVWRDEMRALTLASEAGSVLDLPRTLENEGHPALWYVVLRLAHAVCGSTVVLKVVAAAIGIGAAALVLFRAPLPTWWRVLFVFGWGPLYGGSVLCRNYGIGALLLLWFCACATGALRPWRAAIALALLANTNAYGTMSAAALVPFFAVEAVRRAVPRRTIVLAVLLIVAGIALAAWTMMPTAASKVLPQPGSRLEHPLATALAAASNFGMRAELLFGVAPAAWCVTALAAIAMLSLPHLSIAVIGVFTAAAWFMYAIYGVAYRHLAMLYAFLAAATWLRAATAPLLHARVATFAWRGLLYGVWPPLLLLQGWRGVREIKIDVEAELTAAPQLARLLDRDDLRSAILIGEPDYFLEALPYYRDNRIFVAREGRFAQHVSWTNANRHDLDLGELLATARELQRAHGAPVLLVIGKQIDLRLPDGDFAHGFGDHFRWTAEQQRQLAAATEHVASLPASLDRCRSDELYEVYRLLP